MNAVPGAIDVPEVVLVNGEANGQLAITDRGLHYGDGLFETITCLRGRARFLTLHLERLAEGCRRLRIPLADPNVLRAEVSRLATERDRSTIKLIVTRGPAVARGYGVTGSETSTRILLRYPHRETPLPTSMRVGIAATRLGENPALAGMKHLNRLEQILVGSEPRSPDESERLVFSSSGLLVSGTMSNVFLVQGERLRTPRLDLCGVAGIMRRVVLREASKAGIPVEECDIRGPDVDRATEMFLASSRLGIVPIVAVNGRELVAGDLTRRLADLISPLLLEPADA